MLVEKFLSLGYAIATNTVRQEWDKTDTACASVPSLITISHNTNETSCSSISCSCSGEYCYSTNFKIGSAFGSKSYVSLGYYKDGSCTIPSSTELFLAETCVSLGSASYYAISSKGVTVYNTRVCTGVSISSFPLNMCTNRGGSSAKAIITVTSTANGTTTAAIITTAAAVVTTSGNFKSGALGLFAHANIFLVLAIAVVLV